jgi:hypothetical protein
MSVLDHLIELNLRTRDIEKIKGTGEERIKLNALMLEQERILKEEIGENGFDEVIDAVVDFTDGNISEGDVRKVYAKWA